MNHIEKLKKHEKKTIEKREMELLFKTSSDEELHEIVTSLFEKQILSPIKSSKTNGNRQYPIYLKYKITLPLESYEDELTEIGRLHPLLLNNGYLQNKPEEYKKYRTYIQTLDRYLFQQKKDDIPISRKERSFEIFDEEKILDDRVFCAFLERLGITARTLLYYDTPEYCFNDYIPLRKQKMVLLICENKDVWFNIRRMMFENHASTIFNTHIDGVVYGCGNKVSGLGSLTSYTEFIGAEVEYLYWGDIDRAGLNIYLSTARNNPKLSINLFVPAYEEMLRLARSRNIHVSKDDRDRMEDYGAVYKNISQDLRDEFEKSMRE